MHVSEVVNLTHNTATRGELPWGGIAQDIAIAMKCDELTGFLSLSTQYSTILGCSDLKISKLKDLLHVS